MSEHHTAHPERHETAHNAELNEAAREQLEKLRTNPEANAEHQENRAEAAREVINRPEAKPEPEPAPAAETAPKAPFTIPGLNHKLNYAQTLASVQRQLTPLSRGFSRVIHMPAVEKTSEALEKTVARPSVLFGATWTALIVGSLFYFTARHYGYILSGSQMIFSFVVGALLGLVLEGLWRSLKHRN